MNFLAITRATLSKDMRLEWPGRRPRGERTRYNLETYEETPSVRRGRE